MDREEGVARIGEGVGDRRESFSPGVGLGAQGVGSRVEGSGFKVQV